MTRKGSRAVAGCEFRPFTISFRRLAFCVHAKVIEITSGAKQTVPPVICYPHVNGVRSHASHAGSNVAEVQTSRTILVTRPVGARLARHKTKRWGVRSSSVWRRWSHTTSTASVGRSAIANLGSDGAPQLHPLWPLCRHATTCSPTRLDPTADLYTALTSISAVGRPDRVAHFSPSRHRKI